MKVSIGMKLRQGPWGGGNQFGHALVSFLKEKGVQVFFDLNEPDLDLILLVEPRFQLSISAYSSRHILRYLVLKNRKAIVVHRINECDERKGTVGVNQLLMNANRCADHTVFVSTWLKDLFVEKKIHSKYHSVILNGSERNIFHSKGFEPWDGIAPLKIITHHWGGNWLKGFDIYQRLDELIATEPFKHRVSFTYIGNLPKGFQLNNSTYIEPTHGENLADKIRQHHLYLTASRNEPGGNHQNEGANCGLPLLYRESGCLPEYCQGFGIPFNESNFEDRLQQMINTYHQWVDKIVDYPHTADKMCQQYYELFKALLEQRNKIIQRRSRLAQWHLLLREYPSTIYPRKLAGRFLRWLR